MRIRRLALGYIAGSSLIVLAAGGLYAGAEWRRLGELREAERVVAVIGSANRFVEALALERGAYNEVLLSTSAPVASHAGLLAERVAVTDGLFARTFAELATLGALDAAGAAALRDPIEAARALVLASRTRADRVRQAGGDVATGAAESRHLVANYVSATAAIDRSVVQLERMLAERDPRLGLMLGVSRLSNEMRDVAGQRSTLLARYLGAQRSAGPELNDEIAQLTGAIRITWKRLQLVQRQIGGSPLIDAAVAHVDATFMTEGEAVYARMALAARAGASPPMSLAAWRAWTVPMLTQTLAARDAPPAQAFADLADMRETALHRLLAAIAAVTILTLGVLGAALLLVRRVLKPVADLTAAIADVADSDLRLVEEGRPRRGHETLAADHASRDDELGALARALARLRAQAVEVRALNDRFDSAIAHLPQGLCIFDADKRLVVANDRYAEIYGLNPVDIRPGTPLTTILARRVAHAGGPAAGNYTSHVLGHARGDQGWRRLDALRDGRTIGVSGVPLPGGGHISLHEDVTERLRAEQQVRYLAHHDVLTGLPNRVRFREILDAALTRGTPAAVLFLDLDEFKAVNDTLGHACGDLLLREVAARLAACVGDAGLDAGLDAGTTTIARLGGDEFVILLDAGAAEAAALAKRVVESIEPPCRIDGHHVVVGTSVGLAFAPADAADPEGLMRCADLALYKAKADGRGVVRAYEPALDANLQHRRTLEADLRGALARGEFVLHYQPVVDLAADRVHGAEALLRWTMPGGVTVAPGEFIPIAESTGLIVPIGAWVLREACREAASWPGDARIAVNLSPVQLRAPTLLLDVVAALGASGLSPARLELEITEAVLLQDTQATLAALEQLRGLGVRVAMDDFGTGYSSLSYLRRFPFDRIKIDRGFVRDLAERDEARAIVRAVVGLARDLGIATTVEGIETPEQLAIVRAEGCAEGQGFLLGRPVPAAELPAELRPDRAGAGRRAAAG